MVYWDALFVIIPVPLIDKSQWLTVYKIHNLLILMPPLLQQFKYNLPNNFIAISKDNLYITYPNSNEIFRCQLSAGYHCEMNTLFHPLDSTKHCIYYLLQNNLNKIEQSCHNQSLIKLMIKQLALITTTGLWQQWYQLSCKSYVLPHHTIWSSSVQLI